jgi:type II secretory pathway pseudopilin PulG
VNARQRGFVLPTTVLVVALLTVLLTSAFVLAAAEWRTTDNSQSASRSTAMAQAGLESYFAMNRALTSTAESDSVIINMPGGFADVRARRLIAPGGDTAGLWFVRSHGITGGSFYGGQLVAYRYVGTLARLFTTSFPARAAVLAVNGFGVADRPTDAYPVSGADVDISGCTSSDTVPLIVPSGMYSASGTTPPGSVQYAASSTAAADLSRIDWATIANGDFTPDFTITSSSELPGSTSPYRVYFVNGDISVTDVGGGNARRGILVATGNVTLQANARWDGIIIAGGLLSVNPGSANFQIRGLLITGLNVMLGAVVDVNSIHRGNPPSGATGARIQWSSCIVREASAAIQGFRPVRGTWQDTW